MKATLVSLCLRIPNIDILFGLLVTCDQKFFTSGEENSSTYNICQVVYKNDVCIAYREINASL